VCRPTGLQARFNLEVRCFNGDRGRVDRQRDAVTQTNDGPVNQLGRHVHSVDVQFVDDVVGVDAKCISGQSNI